MPDGKTKRKAWTQHTFQHYEEPKLRTPPFISIDYKGNQGSGKSNLATIKLEPRDSSEVGEHAIIMRCWLRYKKEIEAFVWFDVDILLPMNENLFFVNLDKN